MGIGLLVSLFNNQDITYVYIFNPKAQAIDSWEPIDNLDLSSLKNKEQILDTLGMAYIRLTETKKSIIKDIKNEIIVYNPEINSTNKGPNGLIFYLIGSMNFLGWTKLISLCILNKENYV
jgi:hypothetical protein